MLTSSVGVLAVKAIVKCEYKYCELLNEKINEKHTLPEDIVGEFSFDDLIILHSRVLHLLEEALLDPWELHFEWMALPFVWVY